MARMSYDDARVIALDVVTNAGGSVSVHDLHEAIPGEQRRQVMGYLFTMVSHGALKSVVEAQADGSMPINYIQLPEGTGE